MNESTLKNLVPAFLKELENKGRSKATLLAYRSDLEQLVIFLKGKGKVSVSQVVQEDIENFRDSLLSDKYTPKSVSRKLNAIKTFFRFLVSKKIALSDSSKNVSHPKIEISSPKFLSPLEYRALRDAVRNDKRALAIVELILQAGLRISEVANLRVKDIKNGVLTIRAQSTQPERVINLNESAANAIAEYLVERAVGATEILFVSKNGNPLAVRNIRATVDRHMQKAGINGYSVNDLRTTFIVENLRAGTDLVFLSKIVGHKRLSTTERYLELAEVKNSGKLQQLAEL